MAAKKPMRYPLVEWVAAAIGLSITAAMFGFLAFEALRQPQSMPPVLEAVPVALFRANGQYLLEIEVRNRSGRTGAGVQIEGVLTTSGEEVETSTATVAYVPGDSRRGAGLLFTHDPRQFELSLRVTGYERP